MHTNRAQRTSHADETEGGNRHSCASAPLPSCQNDGCAARGTTSGPSYRTQHGPDGVIATVTRSSPDRRDHPGKDHGLFLPGVITSAAATVPGDHLGLQQEWPA